MSFGKYREPFTIQKATVTYSDSGTPSKTWEDVRTIMCDAKSIGYDRVINNNKLFGARNYELNTWYLDDLVDQVEISQDYRLKRERNNSTYYYTINSVEELEGSLTYMSTRLLITLIDRETATSLTGGFPYSFPATLS